MSGATNSKGWSYPFACSAFRAASASRMSPTQATLKLPSIGASSSSCPPSIGGSQGATWGCCSSDCVGAGAWTSAGSQPTDQATASEKIRERMERTTYER